ncbi:hypothetical protein YC2023_032599 [Brassica napus]
MEDQIQLKKWSNESLKLYLLIDVLVLVLVFALAPVDGGANSASNLIRTQLEESWTGLFSGIRYATNFTKPLCFRHTILSPLGYETALFNGLSGEIDCNGESAHSLWLDPDNTKTARLSEVVSLLKCLC